MAKIMGNTTATAIMVDDKLSLDSKNPIQNKVVTQELNKKINFMGEINENLLPTENNNIGDMYKIFSQKYVEKPYVSGELFRFEMGDYYCYYFGVPIEGLYTSEEHDELIAKNYFDVPIECTVYDTDWNYICNADIGYRNDCGGWCIGQELPDSMKENTTYYIVRSDDLKPMDTSLPIQSIPCGRTDEGYAIFNGESFDKFYNEETVDNKIAEVASTKADIPNPYEYIETITLTEDVTQVNLSTEPDGTPYNFDRFIVYVNAPQATFTEGIRWIINKSKSCGSVSNAIHSSYLSLSIFEVYCDKQINKWVLGRGNFTNGWSNIGSMNYCYHKQSEAEPITHVRLYVNKNAIPTGTTFEIWGVRA